MTSTLTAKEAQAVLARADAATPGPWFVKEDYETAVWCEHAGDPPGKALLARVLPWDVSSKIIAEHIAHARTDVPALVATCEAMAALLDKTYDELKFERRGWEDAEVETALANWNKED